MEKAAVAYYRVSTGRQGKSGLGLEAQQLAVYGYVYQNDFALIHEIRAVKSTRKVRQGLLDAIAYCQKYKATLVVARLDRLGRDVEEIARIVKSNIDIIVVDNPHANRFTIHILAAVAEETRRKISIDTKQALQVAKSRGKVLGSNGKVLAQENRNKADEFILLIKPIIEDIQQQGYSSVRALAGELNRRRIKTYSCRNRWHKTTVHNLLCRLTVLNGLKNEPAILIN